MVLQLGVIQDPEAEVDLAMRLPVTLGKGKKGSKDGRPGHVLLVLQGLESQA